MRVSGRCRALIPAGHECETAPNVGMSGETDDLVLAGYAEKIGAVMVSGDRGFHAKRLTRGKFGQHLYLDMPKPRAAEVLMEHLERVLELMQKFGEGVYTLEEDGTASYDGPA